MSRQAKSINELNTKTFDERLKDLADGLDCLQRALANHRGEVSRELAELKTLLRSGEMR